MPAVETAGYKMADVIGAFFTARNRDIKMIFSHSMKPCCKETFR